VKDISCITTIYAKSQDALGSSGGAIAGLNVECLMYGPEKGAVMRRQSYGEIHSVRELFDPTTYMYFIQRRIGG